MVSMLVDGAGRLDREWAMWVWLCLEGQREAEQAKASWRLGHKRTPKWSFWFAKDAKAEETE